MAKFAGRPAVTRHRVGAGRTWTFVLDHDEGPVEVPFRGPALDVLSGESIDGSLTLAGGDVAIVRTG